MRSVFIMIVMMFSHIFADYHLQGILAQLKQSNKWPAEFDEYSNNVSIYRNDYKVALVLHAFEWSFIVMLPCLLSIFQTCRGLSILEIKVGLTYVLLLYLNTIIHYFIDDLKANDKKINLIQDQESHIVQVLLTWAAWTIMIGW